MSSHPGRKQPVEKRYTTPNERKTPKSTKCFWCGKEVGLKRGRYQPHLTAGGVQCVGNGMEWHAWHQKKEPTA